MYDKWKVRNIRYQDQSDFVRFSKRKFREFKLLIMGRKYLSTETVLSFGKVLKVYKTYKQVYKIQHTLRGAKKTLHTGKRISIQEVK